MTADINIGNLVTSGSNTIVTGSASGLPTEAIVENAVQANNIRADRLDIEISDNDALIGAYDELFNLTNSLSLALSDLQANVGFSGLDTNVFDQRTAVLSTNTGVDAQNLASFAIDEGADVDGNTFVINQVATEFIANSASVVDSSADLGLDGTFEIGLAGGGSAEITVASGDSLVDLRNAINAETATTGVRASILQVSETEFQLILEGNETNREIEVTTTGGTDVLNALGFTDGADNFLGSQIVQAAQGGQITLNGITITRDDNNFDDVIEGVEITLQNADPGTTINLSVQTDAAAVRTQIENFVEAYNALREFVIANQRVNNDGSVAEESVLFSDTILESINFAAAGLIGSSFGNGTSINSLRDIGIGFDENNRLEIFDSTALDVALLDNFEEVQNLFASNVTTSDPNLGLITNNSTARDLDFTLNITTDGAGTITGVSGGSFTVNGTRIIGNAGTEFEGLTFSYIGGVDATINVSYRGGFADVLANSLERFISPDDGLIQQEQELLQSENEDLAQEASEIRARGEEIRLRETEKFADLERSLQAAEDALRFLRVLLNIDSDN